MRKVSWLSQRGGFGITVLYWFMIKSIERTPSPSQQKHLAKKAAAKARKPRAKGTRKVADYLD
jgi:hypothetical protein